VKAALASRAQCAAGRQVMNPPRRKPQSFNLDQIMDRLNHPAESD